MTHSSQIPKQILNIRLSYFLTEVIIKGTWGVVSTIKSDPQNNSTPKTEKHVEVAQFSAHSLVPRDTLGIPRGFLPITGTRHIFIENESQLSPSAGCWVSAGKGLQSFKSAAIHCITKGVVLALVWEQKVSKTTRPHNGPCKRKLVMWRK